MIGFSISATSSLPSRIRKMSPRRKKIAIKRYLIKAIEQAFGKYVGVPYSDDSHRAMVDSAIETLDVLIPKFSVEIAP